MIKNPIVFVLVFLAVSIRPVYVLSSNIEGIEGGIDSIECRACGVEVLVGGEYFDALHKAIGEAKAGIESLYEKYGKDNTEKALEFSSFLNEPRDLKDIETFIRLFDEYGYANVKRTVMKTKDYGLSTGLKDISTVIRLLKGTK